MTQLTKPRVIAAIAEAQPATLRWAVDEARLHGADLEVLHCAGFANYAARVIDRIYFENWEEAAEHVLHEAKSFLAREINPPQVTYRMSDKPPIDELLGSSSDVAAIVLGADDASWFPRMLGPTVSRSLAFTARCPVIVVPEQSPAQPYARGVAVGIEGARPEEHALHYAFEHAERLGKGLQVVHAFPPGSSTGEAEFHQVALAQALAGWSEKFPDVRVTRRFVEGAPSRPCARATKSAELVVVGQPRESRIPQGMPLCGSLLQRARGPVAVVPDPIRW
jgi:nucleotide-binding universal stress UspA family protein